MQLSELDALAWRYETTWGIGRLPQLVGAETKERFERALAMLGADHPPPGRTWEQVRASVARGWEAMAQEAAARGHAPLPPPVAEAEYEPGRLFAIALNDTHRHALDARNKAEGRKVTVWTVLEIAVLIQSVPLASTIKDMFPGAAVLPPRLPPRGRFTQDEPGAILDVAGEVVETAGDNL
jgi:hypothetical protein